MKELWEKLIWPVSMKLLLIFVLAGMAFEAWCLFSEKKVSDCVGDFWEFFVSLLGF